MRQQLQIINYVLSGIAAFLLLVALWHFFAAPPKSQLEDLVVHSRGVPKNPFEATEEEYDAIGEPLLALTFSPPTLELPNLLLHLTYNGTNRRPDAEMEQTVLHFSLKGTPQPVSIVPGEPLYLVYDADSRPPRYLFSPSNQETPLWISAHAKEGVALVEVRMRNENGLVITEPKEAASLRLEEKEFMGWKGGKWQLGPLRVDGTLLARQRARWYGEDLFLLDHGGDEFADIKGKQRLDVGEGDGRYSVFLQEGDCLAWIDERWQEVPLGEASRRAPLLCLKKVGDKILNFELWDVGGKRKVALNLIRSSEVWMPQSLQQAFKFVGARTRSQTIVDIKGERVVLRPQDWLLLTDEGWKKLSKEQDIDDYVDRRVTGPLFIFNGVEKREDGQYLTGTLYNATRTASYTVVLPAFQGPAKGVKAPGRKLMEPQEEAVEEEAPPSIEKLRERIKLKELYQEPEEES